MRHKSSASLPSRLVRKPTAWALAALMALGAGTVQASEHDAVEQLIQSRKFDDALSRADRFLAKTPRDVQMRFLKGVAQLESNRRQEAIATFSQLTKDAPELPEPHNNLAVLLAAQGQYDKARQSLEAALRTNPSYATAQENLGDVYAQLAGDAYSQALQMGQSKAAVAPKLAVIRGLFPAAGVGTSAAAPTQVAAASAPAPAPVAAAPVAPPSVKAPALPPVAPPPVITAQVATPAAGVHPSAAKPVTPPVAAPALAPAPAAPPAAAAAPVIAKPVATPPAPAQAAPAKAVVADDAANKAAVVQAVQAWAKAWAAQDMKRYLAAYGSNFEVPKGSSRAQWEEDRRVRIVGKSDIAVDVEQLSVQVTGDKAVARFVQRYRADHLNIRSRKTLNLQQQGGQWLITREAVGGR